VTKKLREQITSLPQKPGVYIFKDIHEKILYIGKAKNIKKRIQSHFLKKERGDQLIPYGRIKNIEYILTRSERNALILERQLVQKHQPKYNVELKDDKNFFFVSFSDDLFPKISLTHQPKTEKNVIGPFVYGKEFKEYFKNLRRIFPYRTCKSKPEKPCLYYHMGLCNAHLAKTKSYPLVCEGLKIFLALYAGKPTTLEAYDISNTQGSLSVGSMVSFKNGRPNKTLYRMFKIKTVKGSNDALSLQEVIQRRLAHKEWELPNLIVIDGGKGQLSKIKNLPIPIIALAKLGNPRLSVSLKKSTKRAQTKGVLWSPYGTSSLSLDPLPKHVKNILLSLRNEAHRFAIAYHRKRRMGDMKT